MVKATKAALFKVPQDEDQARELLEKLRWPSGPACPHCGGLDPYRLTPKPDSKRPGRKGLLKCRACRKQFTVTVGTIFEDSHIRLSVWLTAFHLICASKKGISSHQLHRMLGVTYKSAWFMAHRIRYAMTQEPLASKLRGEVEIDETYVGGKVRSDRGTGRGTQNKVPVVALVERGGRVRAEASPRVTAQALKAIARKYVDTSINTRVMTDDFAAYKPALREDFPKRHYTVSHSKHEYVRSFVHTNTVEGFFSLLKRSIMGTFHHVSPQHLDRYLDELTFRYDRRHMTDSERAIAAVKAREPVRCG